MRENLDDILKRVLTPAQEPGDVLNRKILKQVKERELMKQKKYKYASAAVITASLIAATSLTAVAAWQYRSASSVAEELGEKDLAKAFDTQESLMDPPAEGSGELPSQSFGAYRATLLGLTSGSGLADFPRSHNGEIRDDRTYCAVMIQRQDGEPVEENAEFFVSPLIGGLNPGLYNAMSLFGSCTWFVEDGVYYHLLDCENIEYFADHELYVCVQEGFMYNSQGYRFDEASGAISRNEDYEGLNALFPLKLDASKADPAKAQELINLADGLDEDGNPLPEPEAVAMPSDVEEFMEKVLAEETPENIGRYCQRMEHTVQTRTPDENDCVYFDPWLVNEKVSDSRGGDGLKGQWKMFFADTDPGFYIKGYDTSGGLEDLVIETYEIHEDGSITFAAYVPKEVSLYLEKEEGKEQLTHNRP